MSRANEEAILGLGLTAMPPLSLQEAWDMRKDSMASSCRMHFAQNPMKIVKGRRQYLFDHNNKEYLDCISNFAHVGHCHPLIVKVAQVEMGKLLLPEPACIESEETPIVCSLRSTLPPALDTFIFLTTGSEANDLALKLAAHYTKRKDVFVMDGAYHGNFDSLSRISPRSIKRLKHGCEPWVHVLPLPDTYKGKYQREDPEAHSKYLRDAIRLIHEVNSSDSKISCFICETLFSTSGIIIPPTDYLPSVIKEIRQKGGLWIADEVATGLGRLGSHMWGFQDLEHDLIPDILTLGKPLGNGYPVAAVVTRRDLVSGAESILKQFTRPRLGLKIGAAVLEVLSSEKLMDHAGHVGEVLLSGLRTLLNKSPHIGDVRGQGLIGGMEIVENQQSKKPSRQLAKKLYYMLKEEGILVSVVGEAQNILALQPPMCFTEENAHLFVSTLERILQDPSFSDSSQFPSSEREEIIPTELIESSSSSEEDVEERRDDFETSIHPFDGLD